MNSRRRNLAIAAAALVLAAAGAWIVNGARGGADALRPPVAPSEPVPSDTLRGLPAAESSNSAEAAPGAGIRASLPTGTADSTDSPLADVESLLLFHVRDARTGADLHEVDIYHERAPNPRRVNRGRGSIVLHPGFPHRSVARPLPVHPGPEPRLTELVGQADSPVEVVGPEDSGYLWIRAAGYSWESIELARIRSAEFWVYLHPAGTLDVHVAGLREAERTTVLVQHTLSAATQHTNVLEFVVDAETTRLENVPAGELRITAFADADGDAPRRSEPWDGRLVADATSSATVELQPAPRFHLVVRSSSRGEGMRAVSEVIVQSIEDSRAVRESWDLSELNAATDADPKALRTPTISAAPGPYAVQLQPSGRTEIIELRPQSAEQVFTIEAIAGRPVRLAVTDADSGEPLAGTMISFQHLPGHDHDVHHSLWTRAVPVDGRVVLPIGPCAFRSNNIDYVRSTVLHTITPETDTVEIELRRAAVLELSLRADDAVVVTDFGVFDRTTVRSTDGTELTLGPSSITVGIEESTLNFYVDGGGPVRLELPPLPDLLPRQEDLTLVLTRGEVVEHTVHFDPR